LQSLAAYLRLATSSQGANFVIDLNAPKCLECKRKLNQKEKYMKKLVSCLLGFGVIASAAFAGESYSGKEMKQVAAPPPCPEWYADQEFNVSLWGTYIFTGNSWQEDRYIDADHAWGGGVDFKYFFHRYFGVGIEGWAASARQAFPDFAFDVSDNSFISGPTTNHENNIIGSVLGTLTLRYPFHCSRFSPYVFVGGGGIFGGGRTVHLERVQESGEGSDILQTSRTGTESKGLVQFGGGLEVRFTPHIGWVNDFSWNVVDGTHNNFGMVRSGINFAF
jgi:hypothetical protein